MDPVCPGFEAPARAGVRPSVDGPAHGLAGIASGGDERDGRVPGVDADGSVEDVVVFGRVYPVPRRRVRARLAGAAGVGRWACRIPAIVVAIYVRCTLGVLPCGQIA